MDQRSFCQETGGGWRNNEARPLVGLSAFEFPSVLWQFLLGAHKKCLQFIPGQVNKTRQHALIFTPAQNWRTTQLHYLFTDGCGGMAHCHAHIHFIFAQWLSRPPHFRGIQELGLWPQIQTLVRFVYNAPNRQVSSSYIKSFGSYRVDKQTHAAENIHLAPLWYAGG